MTLQGSGTISFSQISNEFGLPPRRNLGAYRVSETYGAMTNMPLDDGIPQSGRISFSNFYNKKLNIIVDCYGGSRPPSAFHWDTMESVESGSANPLFRINNKNKDSASVALKAYGTPNSRAVVRIRIANNDIPTNRGQSYNNITFSHDGGSTIHNFGGEFNDQTYDVEMTVGREYSMTFTGLKQDLAQAQNFIENGGLGSPTAGPNVIEFLGNTGNGTETQRIALRDEFNNDVNAIIQVQYVRDISGVIPRKSNVPLFPYQTNYQSQTVLADRYGVHILNLRDYSIAYNQPEGNPGAYYWQHPNISIPEDGNYIFRANSDDTSSVSIGSINFNVTIGGYTATYFLRKGTYTMFVTLVQGAFGPIQPNNPTYFALTIDRETSIPAAPGGELTNVGIKARYNNVGGNPNQYTYIVGGFRGKPPTTSGKKVIAHTNTLIYNRDGKTNNPDGRGVQYNVALRSGIWDSETELIINIGPNSVIVGSGGDGGRGGDGGGRGPETGKNGSSAIGILYPCTIINNGQIIRGHGGGGGGVGVQFITQVCRTESYTVSTGGGKKGGGGTQTRTRTVCENKNNRSTGGGGGGGAGEPKGLGAPPGDGVDGPEGSGGSRGSDGTRTLGGNGGNGGNRAGRGGNGGPPSRSAGQPGAPEGQNGWSILFSDSGVQSGTTIRNNGFMQVQGLYGIGFPNYV
jgi:hypothetical protein